MADNTVPVFPAPSAGPAPQPNGLHRALGHFYNGVWTVALPFLYANPRLRDGFRSRLVPTDWAAPPIDLWLQAASGGEAFLAWELLKELPDDRPINVLLTSGTRQGIETLDKAVRWCRMHKRNVLARRAYTPFDMPCRMRKAFRLARPRALVLLETEIWPGMLLEAKKAGVPVLMVNGRINARSMGGYLAARGFFRSVRPERILAISETDARRFATLFGPEGVGEMPNMKFGQFFGTEPVSFTDNPLASLIAPGASFLVLGSVREQEEPEVRDVLIDLYAQRPTTITGIFPRHMHRVDAWVQWLEGGGFTWKLRSDMAASGERAEPGTIIVWDTFGELSAAYALARAAFVGGSLRPLGGQNFLEPLAQGLVPCIGPYWKNFAWVGRGIVDAGLVKEASDARELVELLVKSMKRPLPPGKVKARVERYVAEQQGGAKAACAMILDFLEGAS